MDIDKIFQSKSFKGVVFGVAIFIIILIIFKAGMIVGIRKADFSCRWSDNYHRNFGGPREGFLKGFGDRDFIEASGTFGQIIKIDGETLVVKGRDDVEKIILINDATTIKSLQDTINLSNLKIDDYIVTIGEPNNSGQIEAKLIRLLPPPPSGKKSEPLPPMRSR